jgi:hypothetical protein
VNTRSTVSEPISGLRSAATVASPQRSRWLPRIHWSPALLIGEVGTSGTASSSVIPELIASDAPSISASSSSEKPTRSRANPWRVERGQFCAQHLLIPAGILRQFVIGQNVGASLSLCGGSRLNGFSGAFSTFVFRGPVPATPLLPLLKLRSSPSLNSWHLRTCVQSQPSLGQVRELAASLLGGTQGASTPNQMMKLGIQGFARGRCP